MRFLSFILCAAAASEFPSAGGKATARPAPKAKPKPALMTVKTLIHNLGEGDVTYLLGATFQTTPERAAALGELVQVLP